ncbi:hypothetical protein ACI2KR_08415 [Pseudomonas luteola]
MNYSKDIQATGSSELEERLSQIERDGRQALRVLAGRKAINSVISMTLQLKDDGQIQLSALVDSPENPSGWFENEYYKPDELKPFLTQLMQDLQHNDMLRTAEYGAWEKKIESWFQTPSKRELVLRKGIRSTNLLVQGKSQH